MLSSFTQPAALLHHLPINLSFPHFCTQLCLNYFATSFMVLDLKESLQVYASVYYVPAIIVGLGSVLGPTLIGAAGGGGRKRSGKGREGAPSSASGTGEEKKSL